MLISDRLTGLALVALGGAAYWGGSLLPPVPGQQVGPNVFPMVVGGGLVVCGALIALRVGASFEERAAADVAAHSDESDTAKLPEPTWLAALKILLPPLLLLFYVMAIDRIGFVPTAFVIILTTSLAMGASLRLALPLAVIAPFAVHLVFYKLLRVPLPAGLVPMPW
jgi:putative tricarboxylic transport membrane protein